MIRPNALVSGCMTVAIIAASFSALPHISFNVQERPIQVASLNELNPESELPSFADNSTIPNPPKTNDVTQMFVTQEEIEEKAGEKLEVKKESEVNTLIAPTPTSPPAPTKEPTPVSTPTTTAAPIPTPTKVSTPTPTPTSPEATTPTPTPTSLPAPKPTSTIVTGSIASSKIVKLFPNEVVPVEGKVAGDITRTVTLQKQTGSTWTNVESKSTSADGSFLFNFKFDGNNPGALRLTVAEIIGQTGYTSPILTVADARKKATVTLANVNTSLNKVTTSTGFSTSIIYEAPEGIYGDVEIKLSRKLSTKTAWEPVHVRRVSGEKSRYSYYNVTDAHLRLASGTVSYKVEVTGDTKKNILTAPTTIPVVSYDKKATTVTSSTLAGKTIAAPSSNNLMVSGIVSSSTTSSRTINIQRYNASSKSWINVAKAYTNSKTKKFSVNLPYLYSYGVSEKFRIAVEADSYDNSYYGPTTIVNVGKGKFTASSPYISKTKTVPWDKNSVYTYVTSNTAVGNKVKPRVYLEKYVGKKWVVVNSVVGSGNVTLAIPQGNANSANGTQSFRIRVGATAYSNVTTTGVVRATWENPNRYTGTARTAYNYMKPYCPTTMITVGNLNPGIWGIAHLGGTDKRVTISSKVPAKHLRTVALHECAHHKQGDIYISSWDSFRKKMNSVYGQSQNGSKGLEQNADCIANIYARNSYWAYGVSCSGARGAAAKAISQGKRY